MRTAALFLHRLELASAKLNQYLVMTLLYVILGVLWHSVSYGDVEHVKMILI